MKKIRVFFMILCIAAAAVISGFVNIMGGIGFCLPDNFDTYSSCGICLFLSSAFLLAGTVIACFRCVLLPVFFNVIGTGFYVNTVSKLYSIADSAASKELAGRLEHLAERHLLTVIVTVLLAVLTALNFFDDKNVKKRAEKLRSKNNKENRKLSEDEQIV